MNYYQFHIGDFNSATRNLTRVQRALYRDLLDMYYDKECPIPLDLDSVKFKLGITKNEEIDLKILLKEFFNKNELGYSNVRCDSEIYKYQANTIAKSKAGKASAYKRKQKSTRVEHALNSVELTSNQEPVTSNHKPTTKNQEPINTEKIMWLDKQAWLDFEQHRKEIKKPLTDLSRKKNLSVLEANQQHQREIINSTIANRWSGLFKPKGNISETNNQRERKLSVSERAAKSERDFIERLERERTVHGEIVD